jgi:hypothetical protein
MLCEFLQVDYIKPSSIENIHNSKGIIIIIIIYNHW